MSKKSPTPKKADDAGYNARTAHLNAKLGHDELIALYRDMVRIRRFEERCLRSYQQGKIGGFLHLYIGQESVAVGCVSVMGDDDHIITAYRDHGHGLAVGMGMNEMMAENYGKYTDAHPHLRPNPRQSNLSLVIARFSLKDGILRLDITLNLKQSL